ncbi:hypothetical protein D3C86_437900 [compost metagenome]
MSELDTFVSSAGMNAAFVQTLSDAEELYYSQHQKLKDNLQYIDKHLTTTNTITFDPNYPVIYPKIDGINEILEANKIIITNFKYPTDTKNLNRIVITANHTKEDLDILIHILNRYQF